MTSRRSHRRREDDEPVDSEEELYASYAIEVSSSTSHDEGEDILKVIGKGQEMEKVSAAAREKEGEDDMDPYESSLVEEMNAVAGPGLTFVEVANEEPEVVQKDAPKAKKPRKDLPSEFTKDFKQHSAKRFANALFGREEGPGEMICTLCRAQSSEDNPCLYRCRHCYSLPPVCKQCLHGAHKYCPLHIVEEWSKARGFWRKQCLGDTGMLIHLGHEGEWCPIKTGTAPRNIVVVHDHGIHQFDFTFCNHPRRRVGGLEMAEEEDIQLLKAGFWSATREKPGTVFTLDVLRQFTLLGAQTPIPAQDYIRFLARMTDNVVTGDVDNRYRELLRVERLFSFMSMCKWSGEDPSSDLPEGSLAVLCSSCPQPGINMDPKWQETPKELMYIHQPQASLDGNFQNNQKHKKFDPLDAPLTMGAAYYAHEGAFAKYQSQQFTSDDQEDSSCRDFVAMGFRGHWGNVSGIVSLVCARHMFLIPSGTVDLEKGERYRNVDWAWLSGLRKWFILLTIYFMYDINCQYQKNFRKRMKILITIFQDVYKDLHIPFSAWDILIPLVIAAVGKFHLPAHVRRCRFLFSMHWIRGSGQTDGEAPERVWSSENGVAMRAREMSSGHRHDFLNHFRGDKNVQKLHNMPRFLKRKLLEARTQVLRTLRDKLALDKEIKEEYGEEKMKVWREEEEDFLEKMGDIEKHKEIVKSVYDTDQEQREKLETSLVTAAAQESMTSQEESLRSFIGEGISVDEMRSELLYELSHVDEIAMSVSIADKKTLFDRKYAQWKEQHKIYLAPLVEAAMANLSSALREAARKHEEEVPEVEEDEEEGGDVEDDDDEDEPETSGASTSKKRKEAPPRSPDRSSVWHELNNVVIELPSSYHQAIRTSKVLEDAVKIETELSKQRADVHLDFLRTHLITSYALVKMKKQATGQKGKVRSNLAVRRKYSAIWMEVRSYRRTRDRLLALGMAKSDITYKPLLRSDVKPFTVWTDDEVIGDSRSAKKTSWIWEKLSFVRDLRGKEVPPELTAYVEDAMRAHWLRTGALAKRWEEEKLLLEEEAKRTIRYMEYYRKMWQGKRSKEGGNEAGRAAYAAKQVYRWERLLNVCKKEWEPKPLEIDVDAVIREVDEADAATRERID